MGCHSFISATCYGESQESSLLRKLAIIMGAIVTKARGLLSTSSFSFFFFCIVFLVCSGRSCDGSMAVEDTPEAIESILDGEDLARIREEFNILVSIKLELPGPSKRVTIRSVTRVASYEEAFRVGLRLPLLTIVVELLKWYQICPT